MEATYQRVQELDCWKEIVVDLDEIRSRNFGIIVSDEALSQGYLRFMYRHKELGFAQLSMFAKELTKRWNVKIVIVYRRYYDWILSAFKESNAKILKLKKNKFPNGPNNDGMLQNPWPLISE